MQISYHSVLKKIQKLQNLKKKKKKTFFCTGRYAQYRPVLPEIGRYSRYEASTAGIFSGMKQGGRVYRIAGRYGIFPPYRPIRYEIDNLDCFSQPNQFSQKFYFWDSISGLSSNYVTISSMFIYCIIVLQLQMSRDVKHMINIITCTCVFFQISSMKVL